MYSTVEYKKKSQVRNIVKKIEIFRERRKCIAHCKVQ